MAASRPICSISPLARPSTWRGSPPGSRADRMPPRGSHASPPSPRRPAGACGDLATVSATERKVGLSDELLCARPKLRGTPLGSICGRRGISSATHGVTDRACSGGNGAGFIGQRSDPTASPYVVTGRISWPIIIAPPQHRSVEQPQCCEVRPPAVKPLRGLLIYDQALVSPAVARSRHSCASTAQRSRRLD